jgi:hypothetical protein
MMNFLRKIKHQLWAWIFDQLFKAFVKQPEMYRNNPVMLRRLVYYWGNSSMAAGEDYAKACMEWGFTSDKNIIECGSGLSTLLVAAAGMKNNTFIYSFEDHEFWASKMQQMGKKYGLTNMTILHAPITDYGDYAWYQPDTTLLPKKVDVALCDGPLGSTKGGRVGLLPQMHSRFTKETVVLLDDFDRVGEKVTAETWCDDFEMEIAAVKGKKSYAILKFKNYSIEV